MEETTLRDNIARVRERIAAAERRAGRPGEVTLVSVSKTQPAEVVAAAYRAGLHIFGENRVEEAGPKVETVRALLGGESESIQWHMIGHLQSRKAVEVLPWAVCVHSVDSVKLAGRLSRAIGQKRDLTGSPDLSGRASSDLTGFGNLSGLRVLLEVNVSGEASKAGFAPDELPAAVAAIAALPGLRVEGLMTMAPIVAHAELARPVFRQLRVLRDALARQYPDLSWMHLSMGMTDDFEVAIEEGATLVRIGRAVFGA